MDCTYCGASFTLIERDLNTICPNCMTRVGDKARFCHRCAAPIVPQEDAGEATEYACPVCGGEHKLQSRQLGELHLSVLECGRCAGLWIGSEVFHHLETQARERSLPVQFQAVDTASPQAPAQVGQEGSLYRPCVVCGKLMNRQNYGRRSGVIIDLCREHGIWFDHSELARVLSWIREGGHERSRQRDREEEREKARQQARKQKASFSGEFGATGLGDDWSTGRHKGDFLLDIGGLLGRLLGG